MPLESAADFNSYVDINTGHGVTATFFEVQNSLWDQRLGLIDTWYDIDSGNSTNIIGGFSMQIFWIILFFPIFRKVWTEGTKKFTAMGS